MNYFFHPSAKIELNEAALYYENCHPGLGMEFLEEVYSAVQRIVEFPEAWSMLTKDTRRCLIKSFSLRSDISSSG